MSCCGCFHGRTLGVISMSCDNEATRGFGPLLPGHLKVGFGDSEALEKIFEGLDTIKWCFVLFVLQIISFCINEISSQNELVSKEIRETQSLCVLIDVFTQIIYCYACRKCRSDCWIFVRTHTRRSWGMFVLECVL